MSVPDNGIIECTVEGAPTTQPSRRHVSFLPPFDMNQQICSILLKTCPLPVGAVLRDKLADKVKVATMCRDRQGSLVAW